jgi:hypothetical protein
MRQQLIQHATASQENRRKSFAQIAEETGVTINKRTLRQDFADTGYHRCVTRVKPFLSVAAKVKCYNWAISVRDWTIADFIKLFGPMNVLSTLVVLQEIHGLRDNQERNT